VLRERERWPSLAGALDRDGAGAAGATRTVRASVVEEQPGTIGLPT
jgi:hypothetical protein